MTITIKPRHTTLVINNDKKLVDNCYLPLNIELPIKIYNKFNYLSKMLHKFNKYFKNNPSKLH